MNLKLNWWQRTLLRQAVKDPAILKWLRERALNLPLAKKSELRQRLGIPIAAIESVQAELQAQAVAALQEAVG